MNIRWLDSAEEELTNFVKLEGEIFGFDVATQITDEIIIVLFWDNRRDDKKIEPSIKTAR